MNRWIQSESLSRAKEKLSSLSALLYCKDGGKVLHGIRLEHSTIERWLPIHTTPATSRITVSAAIIVDSDLKLLHEEKVDFDADLPKYGTKNGVLTNPSEGEIFAPVSMWLEALDLVLQRLKNQGVDFSAIRGVSGAGMQHGTVFWSGEAEQIMGQLDPGKTLLVQMNPFSEQGNSQQSAFSHPFSPNWQDSSTQSQCERFDAALGSPEILAQITGSKAHHRFSGPQILRFRERNPEKYAITERISLVSSFLASILRGKVVPIDKADVCGMNLWDMEKEEWSPELLNLVAGGVPMGFQSYNVNLARLLKMAAPALEEY